MMKLFKIVKVVLLIIVFSAFTKGIYAQEATTYFMHKNQQIHLLNPAMNGNCKFYFSLPGFSFIQPGYTNKGLQIFDILENPSNLRDILEPVNSFNFDMQYEIFSAGVKLRKSYLSLSISNKTNLNIGIPRDFFVFIWEGNRNYIDKTLNLNDFNFDFNNYLELSLGYSYQILENLRIGGKFKILNGTINMNTEYWEMGIYTAPNTYELDVHSNILINMSTPVNPEFSVDNPEVIEDWSSMDDVFTDHKYFTKNLGFGIDLGAVYDYNENLSFSASVIDLFSYIDWNTGVNNVTQNGSYHFSGIDLNPIIYGDGETNDDLLDELTDTLSSVFEFSATNNSYRTKISSKYFISGNYKFYSWLDAGVLISGRYYNDKNYMASTFSANSFLLKFLSMSASYTIYDSGSSNIGLGLGFKLGPVQLYIASDNILGVKYDSNLNIPWPGSSQNLDFMLGLDFVFGCKKKPAPSEE